MGHVGRAGFEPRLSDSRIYPFGQHIMLGRQDWCSTLYHVDQSYKHWLSEKPVTKTRSRIPFIGTVQHRHFFRAEGTQQCRKLTAKVYRAHVGVTKIS